MVGIRRVIDALYTLGALVGGLCLVGIVVLVVAQAACRWAAAPLAGAPELAGYAMANSFFLPLAYAFRNAAHIRVSLLIDRLGGTRRQTAEVICLAIGLGLASLLAAFMCRMAQVSYQIGEVSQGADATPLWIPQSGMALGAVLFAIALADSLVESCHAVRRPISATPSP